MLMSSGRARQDARSGTAGGTAIVFSGPFGSRQNTRGEIHISVADCDELLCSSRGSRWLWPPSHSVAQMRHINFHFRECDAVIPGCIAILKYEIAFQSTRCQAFFRASGLVFSLVCLRHRLAGVQYSRGERGQM